MITPLKLIIFLLFLAVPSNATAAEKLFSIGIVNAVSQHNLTVEGFKAGMAELGYVEGVNINYLYSGLIEDTDPVLDAEINTLVSRKIDLLLTVANEPALRAKKILEGSEIPVVAAACSKMVYLGLVKDLKNPGGNLTGVQVAESQWKALEWFTIIASNAEKILVPYNPDEPVSKIFIPELKKSASQLGVTIVLKEIRSVKEALYAIEDLSSDIDGIFLIPSQTLSPRSTKLSQAASKLGLPLGTAVPLDDTALMSFGSDLFEVGKQAARLADQIRKGVKAGDLPVEISEVFLKINLKVAESIGIEIPYSALIHANTILR